MDRLRHHYEVERSLADQLRHARSRAERARIYETLYDRLFAAVPDHPRLTQHDEEGATARRNARKLRLSLPFLAPGAAALEIGPGDCSFARLLCDHAREVCGVDISAGSARLDGVPGNFSLVLYNGFELPFVPNSFQFALSDQLIEHLHPEDAEFHFRGVLQVLAPGGTYLFRTPHRFTGPHDISRYFAGGDAEGFHLKEWTYGELNDTLRALGYRRVHALWVAAGRAARMPMLLAVGLETLLGAVPRGLRRQLAWIPFPSIVVAAQAGPGATGPRTTSPV